MLNVAIIGCGAIGSSVLTLLRPHDPTLRVTWVVTLEQAQAAPIVAAHAPYAKVVAALSADDRPDLLLECAGHAAITAHVLPALARGIPCIVASVGALTAPGMVQELDLAARRGGTQVQLLSGAIGGIDALSAARVGGLDWVRYTGRKPPLAWKGTPAAELCDLDALTQPFCIYTGHAEEAAQRYPKNANVAATLALAGLGLRETQVQLFADPTVNGNIHHVAAAGAFGEFELTMRGKPLPDNPKTSALTAYSAARAVMNRGLGINF